MAAAERLAEVAARLSAISRREQYDPYTAFAWPGALDPDQFWISPELMTCYGTPEWDVLGERQLISLSHYEAVSFFSLNVHLIRDLIGEVADRIYTTSYPGLSEFFHDFIREENAHAWFFATFCRRYGGRIYRSRSLPAIPGPDTSSRLRDVQVFGRILIAEEMSDHYNTVMAGDERLPAIVRQINEFHHQDEARHIAFGRQIMRALAESLRESPDGEQDLAAARSYLTRYIGVCLRLFYDPEVYADAGLPDPAGLRRRVMSHDGRRAAHRECLGRTASFLGRIGLADRSAIRW